MEPMEIAKAKVLRGDIVESLYRYYGTDSFKERPACERICG